MISCSRDDTITAIATPQGEGGIGIVRISGRESLVLASRIFVPSGPPGFRKYSIHYGYVRDPGHGGMIDEVLLMVMKAPHSYTREDVVEIQCHGGMAPLSRILEVLLSLGARMAMPGEFTRRAFLNGRIDMIQAEAVLDMIRARSDKAMELAFSQLSGKVSRELSLFRQRLIEVLALVEGPMDFPDEAIPSLSRGELTKRLGALHDEAVAMVELSKAGKIYRDGVRVAILGKPNVGKSSLFNVLLGEMRAIVTEFPGTTRDSLEESCLVSGIPLVLSDTAGIRRTDNFIERKGVEKSEEALEKADFVLLVVDSSCEADREDREIYEMVRNRGTEYLVVLSKSDLPRRVSREQIRAMEGQCPAVVVSAQSGEGMEELKKCLHGRIACHAPLEGCVMAGIRQRESLLKITKALDEALRTQEGGFPHDLLAIDLSRALHFLGELLGEHFDEEVLDMLFSQFCVGK
ncbi:MAG: tRNA uridine-5-carboxymethylaminomethyl(34) synthesis GTPase MnmE [Candidatus Eremiobacteraeota bacterium]|nr:tRNA uridine-5-carboxymethylaminomethyl(34) synthesis GTPase MnmE [Candidatus Eremiobacteraeota bacterium]